MTDNTHRGVTRRSVARGAAWAVPAVAVSAAAPALAASGPTARFRVQWGNGDTTAWVGSRTFTATNMDGLCPGTSYQVTITTSMLEGTPSSRNFTVGRDAFQGIAACHQNVFNGVSYRLSASPVLILNQTGFDQTGSNSTVGCNVAGDSPRQQLNITVRDSAGATVTTSNALFQVMDISSAGGSAGYGGSNYWDAVSFPNSPDTTVVNAVATNDPTGNTVSRLSTTSGAGPYRTIAASAASPSPSWTHNFRMPSGVPTQFLYAQHNTQRGMQAIAVSGIEFDGPCA